MGEKDRLKKVVYFTNLSKLSDALENFNMKDFSGKKVPIKLHMGEIKNNWYVKPNFVKIVVDKLKKYNIKPFLFDTTVAYPGLRHNVSGYHQVAKIHRNSFSVSLPDPESQLFLLLCRNYELSTQPFVGPD